VARRVVARRWHVVAVQAHPSLLIAVFQRFFRESTTRSDANMASFDFCSSYCVAQILPWYQRGAPSPQTTPQTNIFPFANPLVRLRYVLFSVTAICGLRSGLFDSRSSSGIFFAAALNAGKYFTQLFLFLPIRKFWACPTQSISRIWEIYYVFFRESSSSQVFVTHDYKDFF
jgi:hypothetical protein